MGKRTQEYFSGDWVQRNIISIGKLTGLITLQLSVLYFKHTLYPFWHANIAHVCIISSEAEQILAVTILILRFKVLVWINAKESIILRYFLVKEVQYYLIQLQSWCSVLTEIVPPEVRLTFLITCCLRMMHRNSQWEMWTIQPSVSLDILLVKHLICRVYFKLF